MAFQYTLCTHKGIHSNLKTLLDQFKYSKMGSHSVSYYGMTSILVCKVVPPYSLDINVYVCAISRTPQTLTSFRVNKALSRAKEDEIPTHLLLPLHIELGLMNQGAWSAIEWCQFPITRDSTSLGKLKCTSCKFPGPQIKFHGPQIKGVIKYWDCFSC